MDNIYITRSIDQFMYYPPEDREYHFCFQIHWAMVAHGDLRFEYSSSERVLGITLAVAMPGLKRPDDLMTFREQIEEAANWKINLQTGDFALRRRRGGDVVETYIYGKKKAPEPVEWLYLNDYEADPGHVGATPHQKGFILSVDTGEMEHLAKKPYAFEYQFTGKVLNGRYLFRQFRGIISRYLPPAENNKTMYEGQSGYIFIRAKDQTPYVLSDRAILLKWLPPEGISALPKVLRNQVPIQLRYWKEPKFEVALQLRHDLRKHFLKEKIIQTIYTTKEFSAAATPGLKFVVSYRSYKGKTKSIREGYSFAFWDIFIDPGNAKPLIEFKCWQDPLDNPAVSAEIREEPWKDALSFRGHASPGHPLNDTKAMEEFIEILDRGIVTLKEDSPDLKIFELNGTLMKGTFTAAKEPGTDIWVLSRR